MHESDAVHLIQPVLDFFISTKLPLDPGEDEYEASLACLREFVVDMEPYWVRRKAVWVIKALLAFEQDIGKCPATLKEAVLAAVKRAQEALTKEVWDERIKSNSDTLQLDIPSPTFINLSGWARADWTRPRKPSA
jgi:hypothetical protein